jgi:hypothetical protein
MRAAAGATPGRLQRGNAGAARPKEIATPNWQGREMIETIHQRLNADDIEVSIGKLCERCNGRRRAQY